MRIALALIALILVFGCLQEGNDAQIIEQKEEVKAEKPVKLITTTTTLVDIDYEREILEEMFEGQLVGSCGLGGQSHREGQALEELEFHLRFSVW